MIDVLGGEVALILTADDIERVYREGKHGVIIDFQDTIPFGTDIERIDLFYNLGLRQVQLTYNLRNLVGDGCTEHNASGITYFGRTVVERLNELNMIVDVSHCSEAVGWDAIELSTSPVIVSHSNAKAVTYHDRAKSDELAKAIADQDGFFGVTIVPGFVQDESTAATLDHFVDHVVHLVNVMGIDHVGIGNDKCGPGGQTGSLVEYPDDMPDRSARSIRLERLPPGAPRPRRLPQRRLPDLRRLAPPHHGPSPGAASTRTSSASSSV